jgi:zinc protease
MDLKQRLVSDQLSPMTYAAEKSQELLQEDADIADNPLGFDEQDVRIIPAEEVFQ